MLCVTLLATTANLRLTYISDSQGESRVLLTAEHDPASVLAAAGMEAGAGDALYYTAFGGSLANLNVVRAMAVTVYADGQSYPVYMVAGTVADALASAGITLDQDDYVEPALDSLVTVGSDITVYRVDYQDVTETVAVPAETEYVYTSLYHTRPSKTTVVQQGSTGEHVVTTRNRFVNGELVGSEVVNTVVNAEATNTVIKAYGEGAPVSPLTGPDGTTNRPTSYTQVLTGKATGYSSSGGKGASGLGLGYGTVAVDPRVIPYGTLLYIESTDGSFVYGYAIATDCGTALMSGHVLVDLYYETFEEARLNGAKTVNVYIVG